MLASSPLALRPKPVVALPKDFPDDSEDSKLSSGEVKNPELYSTVELCLAPTKTAETIDVFLHTSPTQDPVCVGVINTVPGQASVLNISTPSGRFWFSFHNVSEPRKVFVTPESYALVNESPEAGNLVAKVRGRTQKFKTIATKG